MKTTVEEVDPVTVKLTVEVEPPRVQKAFEQAAREIAKQVSLPGFRPGKAPRKLIEQKVGSGAIAQQAMESSLTDYYLEALQQEELVAVSQPDIEMEAFGEDEGCRFEAELEVRPDFDPPDHDGISVTFPDWDVADEQVEGQVEQLRERFSEVEEVHRAADTGDYVTVDIRVEIDGEVIEGGDIEDALYEVGTGGVTPALDEEIVGREAGDEFGYTDTLPDEYPEHGGEEADFTVTVKDVREKTVPPLDDDFAMTVSEFDTIEELRKDIRDSLLRRSVMQAQHQLRGRIVEAYLANIDIPLPPSMVEAEQQSRLDQVRQQAEQYDMEVADLLAAQDMSVQDYEETAAEQSRQAVKAQLVLDRLAQELDLDVTEEDISNEIVRHAQQHDVSPEQIAQVIQQQGSAGAMIGDILRRKAIDTIVAAAEVEGGPTDEVLIELGLMDDPDAEEGDDGTVVDPTEVDVTEVAADTAPQEPAGAEPGRPDVRPGETVTDSGLIVPGSGS